MYPYKWSFNLSISPSFIAMVRVWIGNNKYTWYAKRPLTIEKGYGA